MRIFRVRPEHHFLFRRSRGSWKRLKIQPLGSSRRAMAADSAYGWARRHPGASRERGAAGFLARQALTRDRKAQGEALRVPFAGDGAPELALHRHLRHPAPKAIAGRDAGYGRAAALAPDQLDELAVLGALDLDVAGGGRERPVFGGVGHELVQQQRQVREGGWRDLDVDPADPDARAA